METTYDDTYTVTEQLNDKMMICTAWNNKGGGNETLLHHLFLDAYEIGLNDSFSCRVDTGGGILLETIKKMDDFDFQGVGTL